MVKQLYDLGASERPFRIRPGSEVIITDIHKESQRSGHYIGMKAILVKGIRRWRDQSTNLTWVTAELRVNGRNLKFSLVRFKASCPSRATMYRKGILGNGGSIGPAILCCIAAICFITVAILNWDDWSKPSPVGATAERNEIILRLTIIETKCDATLKGIEGINQNLANIGVLPKKKKGEY